MIYTTLVISLIFTLVAFVWLVKYMEKKLPERDERLKKIHEDEKKEMRKDFEEKMKSETTLIHSEAIKETNRKAWENKNKNKKRYRENIKKGRDYELFISKYFRDKGYQVKEHGLIEGRKDKGIDIIIKKDKTITLIQCKNWKSDSKYKIKHKDLKEFLGNGIAFIQMNKEKAKDYTIEYMFVSSNDILDGSAIHFLRDNEILKYKVVPFPEKTTQEVEL